MNDLRCYVCGKAEETEESFYLVAMSQDVDRVFIVGTKCLPLVKDDAKVAVFVRIE